MERDIALQTIRELIDTKVLGHDYNQALLVAFNELRKCETTAEPYKNCYYAKVCRRPKNGETFTREELTKWLLTFVHKNSVLGKQCERLIKKLDDFETFVADMRGGE